MTAQTMVLPLGRVSPVHIPRRDLVLAASDSLSLRVSIIESDAPSALPVELTGGIGGPALWLCIFADGCHGWGWDYGAPRIAPGRTLGSWQGVIATAPGSFDIDIPSGAFADYPLRCGWAIQLDWDGGGHTEILASGNVHFRRSIQMLPQPVFVTDENDTFVLA